MTLGQCTFGPHASAYIETSDDVTALAVETVLPEDVSIILRVTAIGYSGLDYLFYTSLHGLRYSGSEGINYYGALIEDSYNSGASTWEVFTSVSGDSHSFQVSVVGETGHVIKWSCFVSYDIFSELTGE